MLSAGLTGFDAATSRLEGLPAVVVAALAAKSAALAQKLAALGDGLSVGGPGVAGDRVVTVIGTPAGKAAVVRSLGAGAGAKDVGRHRERALAMIGPAADVFRNSVERRAGSSDPGELLAATSGRIEAELKAAAIEAARGQMGA